MQNQLDHRPRNTIHLRLRQRRDTKPEATATCGHAETACECVSTSPQRGAALGMWDPRRNAVANREFAPQCGTKEVPKHTRETQGVEEPPCVLWHPLLHRTRGHQHPKGRRRVPTPNQVLVKLPSSGRGGQRSTVVGDPGGREAPGERIQRPQLRQSQNSFTDQRRGVIRMPMLIPVGHSEPSRPGAGNASSRQRRGGGPGGVARTPSRRRPGRGHWPSGLPPAETTAGVPT